MRSTWFPSTCNRPRRHRSAANADNRQDVTCAPPAQRADRGRAVRQTALSRAQRRDRRRQLVFTAAGASNPLTGTPAGPAHSATATWRTMFAASEDPSENPSRSSPAAHVGQWNPPSQTVCWLACPPARRGCPWSRCGLAPGPPGNTQRRPDHGPAAVSATPVSGARTGGPGPRAHAPSRDCHTTPSGTTACGRVGRGTSIRSRPPGMSARHRGRSG